MFRFRSSLQSIILPGGVGGVHACVWCLCACNLLDDYQRLMLSEWCVMCCCHHFVKRGGEGERAAWK